MTIDLDPLLIRLFIGTLVSICGKGQERSDSHHEHSHQTRSFSISQSGMVRHQKPHITYLAVRFTRACAYTQARTSCLCALVFRNTRSVFFFFLGVLSRVTRGSSRCHSCRVPCLSPPPDHTLNPFVMAELDTDLYGG